MFSNSTEYEWNTHTAMLSQLPNEPLMRKEVYFLCSCCRTWMEKVLIRTDLLLRPFSFLRNGCGSIKFSRYNTMSTRN